MIESIERSLITLSDGRIQMQKQKDGINRTQITIGLDQRTNLT